MLPRTNELFVADGYGNHRVIVFDADTGAFKRIWGAFGKPPGGEDNCAIVGPKSFPEGEGPPNFNVAHAIRVANDGMVYLADRENRRVQMFTSDGKFVKQLVQHRRRRSRATSRCRPIRSSSSCMSAAARPSSSSTARRSTSWARSRCRARSAAGHHIATDSKGNIYIAQTTAGLQKLVFKGMSAPPTR